MKYFRIVLLFTFFMYLTQSLLAQTNKDLTDLTHKIEKLLATLSTDYNVRSYKKVGERKIIIKGTFDDNKKRFRQVILTYKSGIKKEKTKIYGFAPGFKYTIAYIVKINDKLFFAQYIENTLNVNRYERIFLETLLDGKMYLKEVY